jgi:NADP-dependent 3-hydroxy acid dehydrogenase YdfG
MTGRNPLPEEAPMPRTAVVTGASSGIGAATARALAHDGFEVVCTARRRDRIEALAEEIGGRAVVCDVTDAGSVAELAATVDDVEVLVNNAGGAFDQATVESADVEDWARMFDLNALGIVRVTQALLPALRANGGGLVVNMGSTAGRTAYEGGGGYTAAKHAVRVITQTLRLELVAEPLRFTEIAPGMVKTEEFTLNRVGGDRERYDQVYEGVAEPLVAEDIAEAVRWVATLPAHVDIDEIVLRPRAQAAQHKVHREK